ncbi:MAG TPA: hypothetical protein VEF07_06135, partial [Candidatus Binataceae bacterium]|nr:hypothetical protein [Candidatus Binataceae bacterium]
LRSVGEELGRPYLLTLLAEVCIGVSRFDEVAGALEEARVAAEEREERSHEAEIYRLSGESLLSQHHSNATETRNCFRCAIEIARDQSARWWELRATTSLARLLTSQGRRDEARAMLAEIYNWFTEGFDTADLKDAKALLDRLESES